jgi:hypothetical protein
MQGRASLIMHSYLDRQRIATQMTTQRTDRIDLYRFFTLIRSLRNGVTAYTRSPRGAGLDSPRRRRIIFRRLDPSVGGPGPRDFAVRDRIHSSRESSASIASRAPRLVTIGRNAPLAEAG